MNTLLLTQLLTFIGGIAVLIILHELGHFLAARLVKIPVDEFGIGFPPRLLRLFKIGETEFTLNMIPLGGFVRPRGENDPEVAGGLAAASPWKRLVVLFAGPGMNLLVGLLLAIFLFYSLGERVTDQVIIRRIVENSPAANAGMLPGDLFLEVNGQKVDSITSLQKIIAANLDQSTTILLQRDGQTMLVTLMPRSSPPPNQGAIGVELDNPTRPVNLATAMTSGTGEFYRVMSSLARFPVRLAQGQVSPEEGRLVGYKGMFDIYREIPSPLWFFMMISISLGVLNLLPIPALDGGRILLTLPEIFIHKRIPAKYENAIHLVGFALLIILMIYINVQDFINPIQLPQ